MSPTTYRWLRGAALVPATALVALAMAVPASASAQSTDTQAPSAPTNLTSKYLTDRIATIIDWDASTDNVDAPEDLTYIVVSDDPYSSTQVITGGQTSASATIPLTVTVWAVDRAGNESAKVTVQTEWV